MSIVAKRHISHWVRLCHLISYSNPPFKSFLFRDGDFKGGRGVTLLISVILFNPIPRPENVGFVMNWWNSLPSVFHTGSHCLTSNTLCGSLSLIFTLSLFQADGVGKMNITRVIYGNIPPKFSAILYWVACDMRSFWSNKSQLFLRGDFHSKFSTS